MFRKLSVERNPFPAKNHKSDTKILQSIYFAFYVSRISSAKHEIQNRIKLNSQSVKLPIKRTSLKKCNLSCLRLLERKKPQWEQKQNNVPSAQWRNKQKLQSSTLHAGFPGWPFETKFQKFGLVSSWLAYQLLVSTGNLLFFWLCLELVGLNKFILPFRFYAEKVSSVEIYLLFHCFWQNLCKTFVITAILDRRPRSDISKIWGKRDSKWTFCVITGNACAVLNLVSAMQGSRLEDKFASEMRRRRRGSWKALIFLVVSAGVNGRRLTYGCRKLPMDQLANCGTIVLYPKCAISQAMKSQRSFRN